MIIIIPIDNICLSVLTLPLLDHSLNGGIFLNLLELFRGHRWSHSHLVLQAPSILFPILVADDVVLVFVLVGAVIFVDTVGTIHFWGKVFFGLLDVR